ncbi:XrtA system polysaccharide chain length determinant [Massilia cavernae]|uniref:Chain length-determining protein n=1 Tax=Massilia cavernae TaxID=2320864 RepID=A0A418Y6B3_9BURK|nr:XrtA system polysaccharide chain length determinant [Massilia cavernae]RJG23242.1 chain length-determining protein [Massilia cavernae]
MSELSALITTFLKAIWKYRWHAVLVSWVVAIAGWAFVYRMPDNYQASARVYVDTQSILQPLLSGMTSVPNLEQQVGFMRRTLISRPNVEKVMRMVDLDVKARSAKEHEELVDELMKQIAIGGTERENIYTIAYENPDPKLGKAVVQSLLTLFVEGSFGTKKQDSDKAVQFIDDQIKSYEVKLLAAENALKEFKIRNIGKLPRQGTDFSTTMLQLEEQLGAARLELAEAEHARASIRRQIAGDDPAPLASAVVANPEIDGRIAGLVKNLDALRTQYTDEHPDIVGTKRLIAQLEEKKAEEAKRAVRTSDPGATYSPMLQQMNVALSVEEAKVAALTARVSEYAARAARLRAQSVNAPEIEAQFAQLNRDYDVNKENYEKLLGRREAAKLSGDLSSATDIMTFRVIDPPTVPSTPAGPNRLGLYSIVFAGSLLAGLGVALLLSQIRPTFMSQGALRETLGVPILGSISMNWTTEQKTRRERRTYAFGAAVVVLLGAYGAVMGTILVQPTL